MTDEHKQTRTPSDQIERAAWETPKVSHLNASDAEIGSGSGGDALSQVQS